jgi:small GTP-binding protein
MSDGKKIEELKVVLIGETAVGKTSIISQFMEKIFQVDLQTSTVGTLSSKSFTYGKNKILKFEIWDTAGQERYRSLAKMFYKEANVAILVYDITRKATFTEIQNYWSKEINDNAPANIMKILCANKSDLVDDETVDEKVARDYAKEIGATFHTTSAKNNDGINDLFLNIAKKYTGDENTKIKEGNDEEEDANDAVDEEPKDKFGSMKITKKQSVEDVKKKGCC